MRTLGIALLVAGVVLAAVALVTTCQQPSHADPVPTVNAGHEQDLSRAGWTYVNGFNIPGPGSGRGCDLATLWQDAQLLTGQPVAVFDGRRMVFQFYALSCRPGQPPQVENLGLLDLIARGQQPVTGAEPAAVVQEHVLLAFDRGVDPAQWFGKPVSSVECKKGTCAQAFEKTRLTWARTATSGEDVRHESLGCRQVPACWSAMSRQERPTRGLPWRLLTLAGAATLGGVVLVMRGLGAGRRWDV